MKLKRGLLFENNAINLQINSQRAKRIEIKSEQLLPRNQNPVGLLQANVKCLSNLKNPTNKCLEISKIKKKRNDHY